MSAATSFTRRDFLKSGAAGGAALVIGFYWPSSAGAEPQEAKRPNPFNAWVQIDQQGKVTLTLAKSEMGQAVMTALPMILAEELDVDWANVRVEQALTRPDLYGNQGTGGSSSVRTSWTPLRRAGAAAREMLIAAAAETWNVGKDTCLTEKGAVYHGVRDKRLGYGELVEKASQMPVPDLNKVTLKNPDNFRIVGTSVPRADVPIKVDGRGVFGLDVKLPGMLYAVVARCPTFGGKPARFDAAKAKAVPGVVQVLEIPAVGAGAHSAGGIAVIAESTWAAMQGRKALEIEWDLGPHGGETSESLRQQFEELTSKAGKAVVNNGDVDAALEKATKKVEAVYELPFLAHATMEPMNCTVDIRADRAEAWVPTQGPNWARDILTQISKLPADKVEVHTTLMGGGFGRRYQGDFIMEAAQIAKAVGKPLKLVWTREDDMQHDFYRPASFHRFFGAVDKQGDIAAWKHRMSSVSINAFWSSGEQSYPEKSELGGAAQMAYLIPNIRVEYATATSGVPVAWWRSVEYSISGFVVESFLDELAAVAKVDPVALRLRLLDPPRKITDPLSPETPPLDTQRLKGVLKLAAGKAGWGKPLSAGRGRGIACHYSFRTYVAEVAEVSVSQQGKLRVDRIVCAVDCGRAVHPDGVSGQIEGGIIYGLSAALKEAITIDKGAVQQSNFDKFGVLRMNEAPLIEVHIVPSTEAPTGVGEPGLPPAAAAVTNAIFAATGKRVRRLPIRAEDLA